MFQNCAKLLVLKNTRKAVLMLLLGVFMKALSNARRRILNRLECRWLPIWLTARLKVKHAGSYWYCLVWET